MQSNAYRNITNLICCSYKNYNSLNDLIKFIYVNYSITVKVSENNYITYDNDPNLYITDADIFTYLKRKEKLIKLLS